MRGAQHLVAWLGHYKGELHGEGALARALELLLEAVPPKYIHSAPTPDQ